MLTGLRASSVLRAAGRMLRHLAHGLTIVGAATYLDCATLPTNPISPTEAAPTNPPPTNPPPTDLPALEPSPSDPPPGHPERLRPGDRPSSSEQAIWHQLGKFDVS